MGKYSKEFARIEIDGYIARDSYHVIFSDQPMTKDGFFSDGGVWIGNIKTEERSPLDLRDDMHGYLAIPELKFDNSPRHCRLTIVVGDQVEGCSQEDIDRKVKALKMRRHVANMAEAFGTTEEEMREKLCRILPEINDYLKED